MRESLKGLPLLKAILTGATAMMFGLNAAQAADVGMGVDKGVAAYRSGDYAAAWELLQPAAAKNEPSAQRYLGLMILKGAGKDAVRAGLEEGAVLLMEAARAGDNLALITLEDLRRRNLSHSPSIADMISIEIERAENGDPISAWRLAKRYELGEGVSVSSTEAVRWLKVVAHTDTTDFPKADQAAFKLCEYHASGQIQDASLGQARRWCEVAARKGHPAAAVALKRLARLDD